MILGFVVLFSLAIAYPDYDVFIEEKIVLNGENIPLHEVGCYFF